MLMPISIPQRSKNVHLIQILNFFAGGRQLEYRGLATDGAGQLKVVDGFHQLADEAVVDDEFSS